jgi:hypothetical protein
METCRNSDRRDEGDRCKRLDAHWEMAKVEQTRNCPGAHRRAWAAWWVCGCGQMQYRAACFKGLGGKTSKRQDGSARFSKPASIWRRVESRGGCAGKWRARGSRTAGIGQQGVELMAIASTPGRTRSSAATWCCPHVLGSSGTSHSTDAVRSRVPARRRRELTLIESIDARTVRRSTRQHTLPHWHRIGSEPRAENGRSLKSGVSRGAKVPSR